MKILLISFSTRGAIGDYFFLLALELAKKENVFLMVPSYFDRKIENAKIFRFKMGNSKIISFFNLINPLLILKILSFIKKERFDIVHLIFGEGYPPMLILAPYLEKKKIPLIITIHDPEIHPGKIVEKLSGFLRKFVIKLAAGIHIHTELFRERIKEMGISGNKIFIIPHGSFAPLFEKYKKYYEQNPKIYSNRLRYTGTSYILAKDLKKGREYFKKSIKVNYLNFKSYFYFLFSLLGSNFYYQLTQIKMSIRKFKIFDKI